MRLSTLLMIAAATAALGSCGQGMNEQCGGDGWTGCTKCTEGLVCTYVNQHQSTCQALPTDTDNKTPALTTIGTTLSASMTFYGSTDTWGSGTCLTTKAACNWYTMPGGYSAAVSQNLYGVGPGAGQGPACGTCWKLTGEKDSTGKTLTNAGNSIIVMVNNLCPANGNVLCSQDGLTGKNQYDAHVNFDLCDDSGAKEAFFGQDGVGLAVGTATQVDCLLWSGTVVKPAVKSGRK